MNAPRPKGLAAAAEELEESAGPAPGGAVDGASGDAMTWLEALVLSQIVGAHGLTAYEVMRIVGQSPVGAVSASPGSIYPAVKRLRARGLLEQVGPTGRGREGQALRATAAGERAVAAWAASVGADDAMPHDALLSKVAAFGLLPKAARLKALFAARVAVDAKLERVEALLADAGHDFSRPALQGARALLRARRAWLEAVLVDLAAD